MLRAASGAVDGSKPSRQVGCFLVGALLNSVVWLSVPVIWSRFVGVILWLLIYEHVAFELMNSAFSFAGLAAVTGNRKGSVNTAASTKEAAAKTNTKMSMLTVTNETSPLSMDGENEHYEDNEDEDESGGNSPGDEIYQAIVTGITRVLLMEFTL